MANLQKSSFSVNDILLVRRQDLLYFQIGKAAKAIRRAPLTIKAGLEHCKRFKGREPTEEQELRSLRNILQLIGGQDTAGSSGLISDLITTTLSGPGVLDSRKLIEANKKVLAEHDRLEKEHEAQRSKKQTLPPFHRNFGRVTLEEYIYAVRVLGTTFGGIFDQRLTKKTG